MGAVNFDIPSDISLLIRFSKLLWAWGNVVYHDKGSIKVALVSLKLGRDTGTSPSSGSSVLEPPLLNSRSLWEKVLSHGSNNCFLNTL